MGNAEKLQKFSTKRKTQKITENRIFASQNLKKKKERKSLFLGYFKVKFIIKNLRLVKLLWKCNKNFISYFICQCGRPTLLICALSDTAFLKTMLCKNPRKQCKLLSRKIMEFDLLENRKLATLCYSNKGQFWNQYWNIPVGLLSCIFAYWNIRYLGLFQYRNNAGTFILYQYCQAIPFQYLGSNEYFLIPSTHNRIALLSVIKGWQLHAFSP